MGASNLNKGRFEILESGRLSTAVAASYAVPLLFQPVFIGKDMFVDGGLFNNLPIEPLQKNCIHIIGVSVNPHKELRKLQGMSAIGHRCFELLTWNNNHGRMDLCDLQIELKSISTYHLFDFSKADELFTMGYSETNEILKNLDLNF